MNEVLRQHAKLWLETNQTNTIHANDFLKNCQQIKFTGSVLVVVDIPMNG
jgi:hypothetical protein